MVGEPWGSMSLCPEHFSGSQCSRFWLLLSILFTMCTAQASSMPGPRPHIIVDAHAGAPPPRSAQITYMKKKSSTCALNASR